MWKNSVLVQIKISNLRFLMVISTRDKPGLNFYYNTVKGLMDWAQVKPEFKIESDKFKERIYRYRQGDNLYLGYLRDKAPDEKWTLRLNGKYHVYNVLKGKYIGEVDHIVSEVSPAQADFFALMAYRVKGLQVDADTKCKAGDEFAMALGINTDGGKPSNHAVHIKVYNPSGDLVKWYGGNVLLKDGHGEHVIPFSLNDAKGEWKINVCDSVTLIKSEIKVKLIE
jgi:hypothetical protein